MSVAQEDSIRISPALSERVWEAPETERTAPTHKPIFPDKPEGFDLANVLDFREHGQPHDYFHKLRTQAPISWWNIPNYEGFWALTKYDDVKQCDQDPRTFSSQQGGILMSYGNPKKEGIARLSRATMDNLINLDQPFHMPLRHQHRPFFSGDYVATLRSKVEKEAHRLLDGLEAKAKKNDGRVDFVQNFSEQLPLFTLCEMLGVEDSVRPKMWRWMHYLELASYIVADPDSEVSKIFFLKFLWNVHQMFRYGEKALLQRRKHPKDDLLSLIANTPIDNELMTQNYLDGSWLLIVFAGNDTTRNSLSGTMRLLSRNPEQKQMLLDDPELIPQMVPEALRLVSPVMYMRRTATKDTELRGQKIAKGEKLVMYYGAANRDPDVFAEPDKMDIHRENAKDHLAFGLGPHVCLGQRVANMQLEIAYRCILERFPNIQWTGKQSHAPNNFVHAISGLEVTL